MVTKYQVEDIRTIALVGHGASGKTSLIDALLYRAHAVDRRGNVDEGTSVADFDDEEHKRHFSIDCHVLHADYEGRHIHLLDAPGYPDFVGAALEALNAVETAVIVVSAVNGVEVNTRRMYQEAGKRGLARMLVVNKLDAENVNLDQLLDTVRATFGKACVLFNAPVGLGAKFGGVVSVLDPPSPVPAGCPVDLDAARIQLMDAIVESDDALMEEFLAEMSLPKEKLLDAIPKALAAGTLIPIFCTAAKKDVGVEELLHALAAFAPSPVVGHHPEAGEDHQPLDVKPTGEFVGQVFKTQNDKFVGNLSFLRVYAGRLTPETPFINLRTGKQARINNLLLVQGKSHETVTEALPGDIVAVSKVDGLHIGDTVASGTHAPKLFERQFPTPMFGLAVAPKARGDEQKISVSLQKIADEDPTFKITHDPQTHELVITGVSQLHLDIIQKRLKQRYDLEIVTHEPKIPYRETITTEGAADHRHKKQTGGRGQFGEVHMRIYPLSREIKSQEQLESEFANKDRFEKIRSAHYDPKHNFAFIDHIVGGSIPNQFMPAIEKGCKELLERGALAGYTIQDVAVEVHFGKYHDVDSSEAAFKTAGRMAFKKAFATARPVLLEPIVHLEVTVPSKYTGSVLGDLNTKRGRVENQDSLPGDLTVITARAPLAEVTRYAAQLGSITQGQGTYSMEFSHYDLVPPNVQQQIVSKAKLAAEEDEE
jgi:elongation factor G